MAFDTKKKPFRRLSPSECIEEYPELEIKLNWLAQDIGRLVRMKIIDGFVLNKKGCIVKEESLIVFIDYLNNRDDNKVNT